MEFIEIAKTHLPELLRGCLLSLVIAFMSTIIGLVLGSIITIINLNETPILKNIFNIFCIVLRGTPMLFQIIFWNIITFRCAIPINSISIAIIAISLNSAAYMSQIITAGIKAISKGQIEAAKTLGISYRDALIYIIIPQAMRTILPALSSEVVTLVKDSSLASFIGVMELLKTADTIVSRTYKYLEIYFIVAILYLIITYCLTLISEKLYKKINKYA